MKTNEQAHLHVLLGGHAEERRDCENDWMASDHNHGQS